MPTRQHGLLQCSPIPESPPSAGRQEGTRGNEPPSTLRALGPSQWGTQSDTRQAGAGKLRAGGQSVLVGPQGSLPSGVLLSCTGRGPESSAKQGHAGRHRLDERTCPAHGRTQELAGLPWTAEGLPPLVGGQCRAGGPEKSRATGEDRHV